MTIWQCNIHNLQFGGEWHKDMPPECPHCMRDQRNKLRDELRSVTKQRDALLEAIEIKTTASLLAPPLPTIGIGKTEITGKRANT